jgi:V-type H+-transporting ATPase subunit d
MFDSIATLAVASNMRELYRLVLVDTPLAPYFSENLTHEDLDEMNIEIMRNTLCAALPCCCMSCLSAWPLR